MERQRMKDLLLRARVVVRTSKKKISRPRSADYVKKKLHQNLTSAVRAARLFILIPPIKSLGYGVDIAVAVVISKLSNRLLGAIFLM